jgi:uncharacterized phage protein (TIGR02218 family)
MYRGHHTDLSDELRVIWKGRVVGAKSGKQTIKATIESIFTSLRRTGCRVRYQRTCRHALYFDGCNLNIDDFKTAATVTAITGNVLTVPLADDEQDGFYKSGIVIFDGLYGWISNHTGSALTVILPVPGLADYVTANGSASVFIAPGCDLARATCETKFNNEENFGGFPYMPDNNPFSQSII